MGPMGLRMGSDQYGRGYKASYMDNIRDDNK